MKETEKAVIPREITVFPSRGRYTVRPLRVYSRRRKGKGVTRGRNEAAEDDNGFEAMWQQDLEEGNRGLI